LDPARNLSYVDPGLPRPSAACVLRHYGASLVIYGGLLLLLLANPWFRGLLDVSAGGFQGWQYYVWYFLAYAVLSPPILLALRPRSLWNSKNVLILGWLGRVLRCVFRGPGSVPPEAWRPTFKEKHAFVFLLIKLIYGPLMLNGVLGEWGGSAPLLLQWQQSPTWISRMDAAYAIFVWAVFLLDSALFCFGYHAEAGFLRNEVRYVETTLFGILVCILCYPPFNHVTGVFLGPSNDDVNILFQGNLHHPLPGFSAGWPCCRFCF